MGVRRGWKWRQKIDRCRALEDDDYDGNKVENGVRKTSTSRARAGSLHCPPTWIRLSLRPSCLRFEAEEREVMGLSLKLEAASEKVEDRQKFFRPCRWINHPFMGIMVLTEGTVAVAAAVSEVWGKMRPRRRGGWRRGRQRRGTSSLSYRPCSVVRGRCGHMLLHARPNRGDGIIYFWWRHILSVAARSIGGGGGNGSDKGSWRKL